MLRIGLLMLLHTRYRSGRFIVSACNPAAINWCRLHLVWIYGIRWYPWVRFVYSAHNTVTHPKKYRIGPTNLTEDTVEGVLTVPTVTDNLLSQGTISTEVVGIYFAPSSASSDTNGELTFGGIDTSKTTSAVSYVPITSTAPATRYWGIDQSISYGGTTILAETAGIVDTGTTLILIAISEFMLQL